LYVETNHINDIANKPCVFGKEPCVFGKKPCVLGNSLYVFHRMFKTSLYIKYEVASISSLLKSIGLFCKRALEKRLYSAKQTYHFKETTTCIHPIAEKPFVLGERALCIREMAG